MLDPLNGITCFEGKAFFVTGASGFLGTALICRLIFDTQAEHIYVLCRGGSKRLAQIWEKNIGPDVAARLNNSSRITCYDGDIERPVMGLDDKDATVIKTTVHYVIHSASSINLRAPLSRLVAPVIQASMSAASLALECQKLERFVYVSTAFSNSHRLDKTGATTPEISERIHTLQNGTLRLEDAEKELQQVIETGDISDSYSNHFPWAYGYAKHLTERLLMNTFAPHPEQLLIVRPSVIGPAQSFPFPGYEVAGSAPLTMLAASMLPEPAMKIDLASGHKDPWNTTFIDEVPVDVVVNRLVAHLAAGTQGIIHAVAGKDRRYSSAQLYRAINAERLLPWSVGVNWKDVHWHTKELHPVARIFVIFGTSYIFRDDRTADLWSKMDEEARATFPLFSTQTEPDFSTRRPALRTCLEMILKKTGWSVGLASVLCRPVRKNRSSGGEKATSVPTLFEETTQSKAGIVAAKQSAEEEHAKTFQNNAVVTIRRLPGWMIVACAFVVQWYRWRATTCSRLIGLDLAFLSGYVGASADE